MRRLCQHPAERITEERLAPELDPLPRRRLSANVAGFEADPIYDRNVDAIRNRVCPLNRPPCVVLSLAELRLLCGMPTNRRRIKKYMRPLQRRQPCAFRIPLIPADQGT